MKWMLKPCYLISVFFALNTILMTSSVAQEESEPYFSDTYHACTEEALSSGMGVPMKLLDCTNAEYTYQDAQLNQAYKQAMQRIEETQQKRVKEAQRAWIKYRDAHCDFFTNPDAAEIAELQVQACLAQLTAERTQLLSKLGVN